MNKTILFSLSLLLSTPAFVGAMDAYITHPAQKECPLCLDALSIDKTMQLEVCGHQLHENCFNSLMSMCMEAESNLACAECGEVNLVLGNENAPALPGFARHSIAVAMSPVASSSLAPRAVAAAVVAQSRQPQENPKCVACLAEIKGKPSISDCNHSFHPSCFEQLINLGSDTGRNVRCPKCNFVILELE